VATTFQRQVGPQPPWSCTVRWGPVAPPRLFSRNFFLETRPIGVQDTFGKLLGLVSVGKVQLICDQNHAFFLVTFGRHFSNVHFSFLLHTYPL